MISAAVKLKTKLDVNKNKSKYNIIYEIARKINCFTTENTSDAFFKIHNGFNLNECFITTEKYYLFL